MINFDRKPAMHNPVNKNQSQPTGPGNNAPKPRASAGEADAFNACMRKSVDQSAKTMGYQGKAKETGADHGKKKGYEKKDRKNHAGEGKAKESGADHGKKKSYEKENRKNHAGQGKAKESGADHGKKKGYEKENTKNHAGESKKEADADHGKKKVADKKIPDRLLDESIPVFIDEKGVQREYGKPSDHDSTPHTH
jgi:hypothetical protein